MLSIMSKMYVQGHELKPGQRATCLSSLDGIVSESPEYLVTNETDKKGNPKLANVDNGSVVVASRLSVWSARSNSTAVPVCGPR